jgi:hypothetical protein
MLQIKKKIFSLFLLTIFLLFTILSQAQIQKDIILCMQKGNSKKLSEFFNQNVELAVLENNNVYSKAQAQQILGKFFTDYTPVNFSVLTDEMKKDARYIIGTLTTNKVTFRVYILLKKGEDKRDYIHLLKIEKR